MIWTRDSWVHVLTSNNVDFNTNVKIKLKHLHEIVLGKNIDFYLFVLLTFFSTQSFCPKVSYDNFLLLIIFLDDSKNSRKIKQKR